MIKLGRVKINSTAHAQTTEPEKYQIKMTVFTRKSRQNWVEKKKTEIRTHTREIMIQWFNQNYPQLMFNYDNMSDILLYDLYEMITFL